MNINLNKIYIDLYVDQAFNVDVFSAWSFRTTWTDVCGFIWTVFKMPLNCEVCYVIVNWFSYNIGSILELLGMHGSLGVIVSPEMSTCTVWEFLGISPKEFVEHKVFIVSFEYNCIRILMTITAERVISFIPVPLLHFVAWIFTLVVGNNNFIQTCLSWMVFVFRGSSQSELFRLVVKNNVHTSSWDNWLILGEIKLFNTALNFKFVCDVSTFFNPGSSTLSEVVYASSFIKISWA